MLRFIQYLCRTVNAICCACARVSGTRRIIPSSTTPSAERPRLAGDISVTQHLPTAQLRNLDALHHLHPFTNHQSLRGGGARVIVKGDGPYIWDSEGNKILDGMAGLWTTAVGYGRKELADAAYQQMMELPFYNTFFRTTHPPVIALSAKIAEIAPANLNQVFFGSSGSESNDTAIRLIRHYWMLKGEPKRRIIISRHMAYHGSTIAAGSMGGMPHVHAHSYPVYEGFTHIIDPYHFGEGRDGETVDAFGLRAAQALEDEILRVGPENVAAFAAEPVQGVGGVKIPSKRSSTSMAFCSSPTKSSAVLAVLANGLVRSTMAFVLT
jgi:putrescine---pyruvate transaminase